MTELLDIFYAFNQVWIGAMLTVQSLILYKLLPEIKKMSFNSEGLGKMFGFGKDKNNKD